jgi:hypothetical protein
MMTVPTPTPRFSIIIPLEVHRGQAEACLYRWAHEQTYPRGQYEILALGCRDSLSQDALSILKSRLGSSDRLLLFDEPHDMALCAYGAQQAKGDVLFFTASHCLPEPNILSMADETLRAHPEWAGFSCRSLRITPNSLSIVEADMYEADIRDGMEQHPRRKILDQCFVVRAESYHSAGGFRPEFGHFAEWQLAAQMHQMGLLLRVGRRFLRAALLRLIDATVRLERIRFVQHWLGKNVVQDKSPYVSAPGTLLIWQPDNSYTFCSTGIHAVDEYNGQKFQCFEPVGMIEVFLNAGKYCFSMEWLPFRDIRNLIVYRDEKPISTIRETNRISSLPLEMDFARPVRFAWTCEPRFSPRDPRLIGLPIVSITWTPAK